MIEAKSSKDDSQEAVVRMSPAIENAAYVLRGDLEPVAVEAFCSCTEDDITILRVRPGKGK
jgi:hypothetical protein